MIQATIAGVGIVGARGGVIKPIKVRWEKALTAAEAEATKIMDESAKAPAPPRKPDRPCARRRVASAASGADWLKENVSDGVCCHTLRR